MLHRLNTTNNHINPRDYFGSPPSRRGKLRPDSLAQSHPCGLAPQSRGCISIEPHDIGVGGRSGPGSVGRPAPSTAGACAQRLEQLLLPVYPARAGLPVTWPCLPLSGHAPSPPSPPIGWPGHPDAPLLRARARLRCGGERADGAGPSGPPPPTERPARTHFPSPPPVA